MNNYSKLRAIIYVEIMYLMATSTPEDLHLCEVVRYETEAYVSHFAAQQRMKYLINKLISRPIIIRIKCMMQRHMVANRTHRYT